jgi:ABC-2 type transport system permease protein
MAASSRMRRRLTSRLGDLLMRATPLPPAVDLASRAILAIVFAAITLIVLFAIAFLSGVRLSSLGWLWLMLTLILGSLPLLGLSFAIAYLTGANAATATMNMLYMILAFASGMLVPMNQLPSFVQQAAPYLPTYHLAQLGWSVVGAPAEQVVVSLAWLAGYGVLFFTAARWAYRRDTSQRFH